MKDINKKCFGAADILLPDFNKNDAYKWAVVACDQFTSEPEYWEAVTSEVSDAPSMLNVILPEVYLSESAERIPLINATMKKYFDEVLVSLPDSMIYVERTQSDESVRRGIVLAVDLEAYDYTKGASSLIRATEATVLERIPPRVAIRRGATIESPHVMLLIDDSEKTVIEPISDLCTGTPVYDTPLMLGGGHIKGWILDKNLQEIISEALISLVSPEKMAKRYGSESLSPLLFAVGDGNHSLATAKATYEELKADIGAAEAMSHPARYALVEVVNIHDDALKFEPIYRVMFGVDASDVISELEKYAREINGTADAQKVSYMFGDSKGEIEFKNPVRQLTVGTLQDFIDGYIASHKGAEVDYIHGVESVRKLAAKENAVGFIFSGMEKNQLFKTVIFDGALPRKTFSMGHAEDKRYYMECRKITK